METITGKTETLIDIEDNYKLFKVRNPKEKYLKNEMKNVCKKLENDLKWYDESTSDIDVEEVETIGKEESIHKETIDKKFAEKAASRLVEDWWLGC